MAFIYLSKKKTKKEIFSVDKIFQNNNNKENNEAFDTILEYVHNRITTAIKQKKESINYMVPYFILGCTTYSHVDCIAYLVYKLNEEGFKAQFLHPHHIIIGWDEINTRYAS